MPRRSGKPPKKLQQNSPNNPPKDLPKEPQIPKKSLVEHPKVAVGIEVLGWGLQMTGLQLLGIVLIIFGAGWLWWIYLPTVAQYIKLTEKKLLWGGWVGILLLGMGCGWWIYRSSTTIPQTQVSSTNQSGGITAGSVTITRDPSLRAPKTATLVVRYRLFPLHILGAPGTDFYILGLHPRVEGGLLQVGNGWRESNISRSFDEIIRCDVQNLGEAPISNAEIIFGVDFLEELNRALEESEQLSKTGIIAQKRHVLTGVLDAKETFTFYIVNQSLLHALLVFPDRAVGRILGESEQRVIPLVREKIGVIDKVPAWVFMPSSVEWPNLFLPSDAPNFFSAK